MIRQRAARLMARWREQASRRSPASRVGPLGADESPAAVVAPPVRVESDVGPLLFQAHDRLMVPMITEHGRWEAEESDLLRSLLAPGMTFVDVGACVGYMTLLGARAVGPTGRVIAVEASPANVALLWANVAANRATNVEVVAAAASDRTGTVPLSLSPWNTGDNRAYPVPEMETVEVPAVRLDDVISAGVHVDVVKLDTQGTDHRAVRGMEATVARCRPVLVVEFWPLGIIESGEDPLAVVEQYTGMGYEVRVLGAQDGSPAPSPQEVVDAALAMHGEFATLVLRPAGGSAVTPGPGGTAPS